MSQIIVLLLVLLTTLVNGQLQFNIYFQIDSNSTTSNQRVYLFNLLNDFSNTTKHVSLDSLHTKFQLIDQNGLIYLDYLNLNTLKCNGENHKLKLKSSPSNLIINLNVTIYDYKNKNIEECSNRVNIEYIFKVSNESEYGLIKNDMNQNGIIAIIRIDSSLVVSQTNDITIRSIHHGNQSLDSKHFMLKKFMTNFYMLCLTETTRNLFDQINYDYHIRIELNLTGTTMKYLNFKLINAKNLEIQLIHQSIYYKSEAKIIMRLVEQYGTDCNGGVLLFSPNIHLEKSLFQTDSLEYIHKNIRFSLVNSNVNFIELDSINGNLIITSDKCLDREQLTHLNSTIQAHITVYDQRKLLKSLQISLQIRIDDLNDNQPKFKQNEYNLELNEISTQNVIIFSEQAIDLDENSLLFYDLIEATSYYESKSYSTLNLFQINMNQIQVSSKIYQRKEKYYMLRLLCRDNGSPIQFTIIKINLKVNINLIENIVNDYMINLDDLNHKSIRLGSLSLQNGTKFNSSHKQFNLEIDSDNNLIISKLDQNEIDKFSFVKFENQKENLELFIRFTSLDKYQFGQNFYEFVYAEDHTLNQTSSIIGSLETDCSQITSIKTSGQFSDLFEIEIKNNQIFLLSNGYLDYEYEQVYDFKIYSVCSHSYLMTTRVNIKLIDINDNQPKFINPIHSNQIFYLQLYELNNSSVNVTRIKAVDHDKSEDFKQLKYHFKSNEFFYLNESTGDLYFLVSNRFKINQFLEFNLELTAFNDLYDSMSRTTIQFKVIIFIQLSKIILKQDQVIKSVNNLVEFNLLDDQFSQTIDKCLLINEFQKTNINQYHLSISNFKLNIFKRNDYLNIKQFVIECQLIQVNNKNNLLGWIQFSVYLEEKFVFKIKKNHLHYHLNRLNLINSNKLIKIDQLNDLNIEYNQLLVYNLNTDNSEFIKSNFDINKFTGELAINPNGFNWIEIISNSDLIKIDVDVSLLFNRNEHKETINVYLHLTNTIHESLLVIKSQLDKIEHDLSQNLIKIKIENLSKSNTIQLIKQNKFAQSYISFQIEQITKLDLTNNNDVKLDLKLFQITNNEFNTFNKTNLVLNLNNLEVDNEFIKYYQVKLKVCLILANSNQFDLSKECKLVNLITEVEVKLDLNEIRFKQDVFKYSFDWMKISPNVASINLISLIKNSSFYNIEQIIFKSDSDLVTINNGLMYFKMGYFMQKLELNLTIIDLQNEKNLSITKIEIDFFKNKRLIDVFVQLDDENTNEKVALLSLNETKSNLNIICQRLNKLICQSLFEIKNSILILNQIESRKHLVADLNEIELIIKSDKIELINVNLTILIVSNEIQNPTFEHSSELVHLVDSKSKKAMFQIDTLTRLEMIRVKNLITNNEVLALDCQFKSVNKSSYVLNLDDVMSLELNQIYSFDFKFDSFMSSIYVIRLQQIDLESVLTMKQFASISCDNSMMKQLVMNLSKFDDRDDMPTSLFTQKIYLIKSYSNLNVKYFKIYTDSLYLVNTKYNCDKITSFNSSIKISKFYIDKISLRIRKVTEIDLRLEILSQRTPRLNSYYHQIKIFKTDLINSGESYDLDDFLIYEFNLTQDYQFSIDYLSCNCSLPFSIDQFSGRLKYLPSEDKFEFDSNGERYFSFDVQIASTFNTIELFRFEFILIDNDPIILINENSLTTKFYIKSTTKQIGHLDLANLVKCDYLKAYFASNKHDLMFKIQDWNSFFHVDQHGLLYLKNAIDTIQFDFNQINLKVNGTIGNKLVILTINVVIVVEKFTNYDSNQLPNHEFDFYLNSTSGNIAQFQLQLNDMNVEIVRYKNLSDFSDLCQISWLYGHLFCSIDKFNQLKLNKFTLNVLLVKINKNNHLNQIIQVNHVKINLINFESYLTQMKNQFYLIETISQISLNLTLKQETNQRIQINLNQYLIELGFKIDLNNHRFLFSPIINNSFNHISNYFILNQYSSELVQFRLINESFIQNIIHLIELLEDNNFRIVKIIDLKIKIESILQSSFSNFQSIYIDLNNSTNSELIKINNVYSLFRNDDLIDYNYFLTDTESFDYPCTNTINLENLVKISLNKSTGDLFVDKTNVNQPSKFKFYLIRGYAEKYDQITYEINFKYNFNIDSVIHMLNDVYESSLEFQIVIKSNKFSLNLNSLLFNKEDLINQFEINLTSSKHFKVPFEIDKLNYSLIYSKTKTESKSNYDLIITLNNYFDFMLKFVLNDSNYPGLVFDSHLYQIEINLLDFNSLDRVVLEHVNAYYLNNQTAVILYQFIDSDITTSSLFSFKRNLRKLIKLDSTRGEIELVKKNWVIYLDYCNQLNQFESNHLSILYTINAIDKDASLTNFEAKSIVKLNIKCDHLKETFQFEKSSYQIQLNENTKLNELILRINTKKTHLTNSMRINYYFCNLKMNSVLLNPFSLSQKTGHVYLTGQFNKTTNYSFEICANLEYNFMNKIIRTSLDITTKLETKFDFSLFNLNQTHQIQLPLTNIKTLKLFQINSNSNRLKYDHLTEYSDSFQFNTTTKWLSLNLNKRSSIKNSIYLKTVIIDNEFKRELNFKFNLVQTKPIIIQLNYPNDQVFDLKQIFPLFYQYLVIIPNDFIEYNSTNGLLTINNYLSNKLFECDLKLISFESDIKYATIQVNPLQLVKSNKIELINDLFISKYAQFNTIVYNLNDLNDQIIELINQDLKLALFSISSNLQSIYLKFSLFELKCDSIMLTLITRYQFIKLKIYLIENIKLKFSQFSYFFKYSNSNQIGSVDFNFKHEYFQFKLKSVQIKNLICLTNMTKSNFNDIFYLNDLNIYLNISANYSKCDLYEFELEAQLDTNNISTHVYIELSNQINLSKFNNLEYSTLSLTNLDSINLYQLFENVSIQDSIYSVSLLESDNSFQSYEFNHLNGLLTIQNMSQNQVSFKINILIQENNDYHLIKQFNLKIFNSNKNLFKQSLFESRLNYSQTNRLFNDRLQVINLTSLAIQSVKFNSTIIQSKLDHLFSLDENILYFNSNQNQLNQRYFFNFSQLIKIKSCYNQACEHVLIHFEITIIQPDEYDLINEYYNLVSNQIFLKMNSNFNSYNLAKLKNFNNKHFFSLNNNLVDLNNITNILSIKTSDIKDFLTTYSEEFKLDIIYDTNKRIELNMNYGRVTTNRLISTDFVIDLFFIDTQMNQTVNLIELIESVNRMRYACDLWETDSKTNEKIHFLESNCQLVIIFNSTQFKENKNHLNLQIRAFDKLALSKSIFFSVRINLIRLDMNHKKYLMITSQQIQKLANLNKNLKLKLNCYLVNEIQTLETQSVLIRSLDDEFNSGLVYRLTKLLDSVYGVANYEMIYAEQKCFKNRLVFESLNMVSYFESDRFNLDYSKLIQTSQYVLITPDLSKQTKLNKPLFQFSTSFKYDFLNLNRVKFKFEINSDDSFLIGLSNEQSDLNLQVIESKLGLFYSNGSILLSQNILKNTLYQIEISIKSQIEVKLRKNDNSKCNDDTSIQTMFIKLDALSFESVSFRRSSSVSFVDFRLNDFDLLENKSLEKFIKSNKYASCNDLFYSLNCDLALSSFKLYLNGRVSKLQLKKQSIIEKSTLDLSIKFKLSLDNISSSQLTQVILLQSLNSILRINFQNGTQIEYYEFNKLIGFININIENNTTYNLKITEFNDKLKLKLNNSERDFFYKHSNRNDLLTSDYIEINNKPSHYSTNIFIIFKELVINNEKIPLFDGFSSSYKVKFILLDSIDSNCCHLSNNADKNITGVKNLVKSSEENLMNSIIIATALMSFVVCFGIFIFVFSYSNGKFRSEKINKIDRIITDKTSKFNSRNKLELSINSEQNSLDHSPNTSFSRDAVCGSTLPVSNDTNKQYETLLNSSQDKHPNQQQVLQKKVFQNCQFDFNLLNWQPSYGEFKFVISEFKEFPCSVKLNEQSVIYHESDNQIDIYLKENNFEITNDYIDKQTFV